ncbi:MAG: Cna B-type domain-containing protein [Limosilactobacillus pontis]|uniref:Cna B-type domain-containing protein n=1 Tax=Limosilactobacillus pontis TaxID=35787 RepID=UPI0039A14720
MNFRLQRKRMVMVLVALLTVFMTFFFMTPVNADDAVVTSTTTMVTNQANAPNKDSQPAAVATPKPVATTNTAQNNQSTTELEASDAANDTKSAATANQTLNSNLSIARDGDQESPAQAPTSSDPNQVSPKITVDLLNGVTDKPLQNGESLDQYTPIRFELNYDLSGTNVYPGNYFTFSLPDTLKFTGKLNFKTNLGEVAILGNTGHFTFTQSGSDAHGQLDLTAQLNSSKINQGSEVPITIKVNGQDKMTVNVKYVPNQVNKDELFSKYAMNSDLDKGNLRYAIRVNPSGRVSYQNMVIRDQLQTPGFTYDKDSFTVQQVQWIWDGNDWQNQLVKDLSTEVPVSFNADDTSFAIDLGDAGNNGYLILYSILYGGKQATDLAGNERPEKGTVVHNSATLESSNHAPINYRQTLVVTSAGGQDVARKFDLQVKKQDPNGTALAGAQFELIQQTTNDVFKATTGSDGIGVFKGLLRGTYTLREVAAPAGYQLASDQDVVVNQDQLITVTDQKLISIPVHKVWSDQGKHAPVQVELLLNNNPTGQRITLSDDNDWQGSFENLVSGNYSVKEIAVPTGYQSKVTNDPDDNGFTITNDLITTSVKVKKVWDDADNQDGKRPESITVQLLANGEPVEGKTLTLSKSGNGDVWTGTFTDLPEYQDGTLVNYTVKELNTPDGYTSKIENVNNDFTITNSHTPAMTAVTVKKVWDDTDNQDGIRPTSVKVNLLANETVTKTATLSADNNWSVTWDNLPVYQNGKQVTYSVEEINPLNGYTVAYTKDGSGNWVITNTHVPATTSATVKKVWNDDNNQDGKRPGKVTVNLMNGQTVVRTVELSADTNWQYTWKSLPKYQNGKLIAYTVEEVVPTGYTASYDQSNLTIINTHTPATVEKTVKKVWADGNDQDGLRPDIIQVKLLADGQVVDTVTLTASDHDWTHTWTKLNKYAKGKTIAYTVEEVVPTGYAASYDQSNLTITNAHMPATIDKTVTKQWSDDDDQDGLRPANITVNLFANGKQVRTLALSAAHDWTATVYDLPKKANGQDIVYTWREANVPAGYQSVVAGDTITNSHTPATTAVTAKKIWQDNDNQDGIRPVDITVNLLANGKQVQKLVLNAANGWTATVADLPKKANGQDIVYSWQEADVPAGYTSTVAGDTITNSHTPATTSITVKKVWNDANNQDGIRPTSVTANLLANGQVVKTAILNAANDWTRTWTDLPVYQNGKRVTYAIAEANVPAGYQSTVAGDTITNSHTPTTTAVTVKKIWKDANDQDGIRPASVTTNLLANGKVTKTAVLDAADNWMMTWTNLPVYQNGKRVVYTVAEVNIPAGYTSTVAGDTITNSHTPATTSVIVKKAWDDANNQDGIRPSNVTANLLADGEVIQTATLNAANKWMTTWNDLPVYQSGKQVVYTVAEANVPTGYTSMVDGDTITNRHVPVTTAVTVKKVWDDASNQDGIRPSSVTANLLANGKVAQTATLTAANNWTATWANLPVYQNGKQVTYTVAEAKVPAGYQSVVDGDTITNSHTPATTLVTVKKVWNDANNQDGIRPSSVTANLLANGKVAQTATLTAANNWTATWANLPVYQNGKQVTYTVAEVNIPAGYTSTVDGDTITNSHTPATTSVMVKKVWEDTNDQDGIRPSSITANLLTNGKIIQTATLTAANDWTATWTNLPVYQNGKRVTYTVAEAKVPAGYQSMVAGDTITNSHTPATTSVTVKKVWNDANNQDGIRPTSVTANLLADGQVVKTATLNATNDWTMTWTDLPVYQNGKQVMYTVAEANVPAGYQSTVDGDVITNNHTPATTTVTVKKAWNDANNQDGIRPSSVTANLLANGKVMQTATLTAANDWTATWKNLPVYQNGKQVTYTVAEASVPAGYTSTVVGDTITNSHMPVTTAVTVKKIWKDANDQDGIRPASVTTNLLANGKVTKTAVLDAADNWMMTWTDLPVYQNGKQVTYTVAEATVPAGYQSTVAGDVITNSHTPATTTVTVKKAWNDANNQDGIRPASVTVNLLANGKVVQTATLTANDNWTATWANLPVYQNGKQVTYTIVEAKVPAGYQSMVSQNGTTFTVTNTHQPKTPGDTPKRTPNVPTPDNTPDNTPDTPTPDNTPDTPTPGNTPDNTPDTLTPVDTPDNTPVTPTPEPVQPVQQPMPVQPVKTSQPAVQGQPQLPQTGNHNGLALMVLGLVLLSLTFDVVKLH